MRSVTVNGKRYKVHALDMDTHYSHSVYYARNKLHDGKLFTDYPYGYIVIDDENILCYHNNVVRKYLEVLPVGILGVFLLLSVLLAFIPVELPDFSLQKNRDNVVESLDFGVSKLSGGIRYSKYAIYDGKYVGVYISSPMKNREFAVRVNGVTSPYSKSTQIETDLKMEISSVTDGELLIKKNEDVDTYPIVIEYLQPANLELPIGEAEIETVESNKDLENFDTYSVVSPKER